MQLNTELVCTAEFTAKPGLVEALIEEAAKLITPSRKEPGCLRYELHKSLEHSDVIYFIERFQNRDAFDQHSTMPYIKDFFDNVVPRLVKETKFAMFHEIS